MQDFILFLEKQQLRPKTVNNYVSVVERFVAWYLDTYGSDLKVDQLQELDFLDYRSYLLNSQKLHAKTVNKHLAGLRKWLEYHQRAGRLKVSIQMPDVPFIDRPQVRWLSKNDVMAILYAVEQEPNDFLRARDRAMICLELYRGLRVNEYLQLAIDDVILTQGRQHLIIRDGKGGVYAEVDISGNRKLVSSLHEWIAQRSLGRFADSPFLFTTFRSGHATYGAVERMVQRLSRRAGVEFTTHQLRHTFGHDFQSESKNLNETKLALRHRDIRSTLIYTQPSIDELKEIYLKIDRKY